MTNNTFGTNYISYTINQKLEHVWIKLSAADLLFYFQEYNHPIGGRWLTVLCSTFYILSMLVCSLKPSASGH